MINDTERDTLRALALLVDDGVSAALKDLVRAPTRPVSAEALCTLRVATVLLAHELETGDPGTGEWAMPPLFVTRMFWLWAPNSWVSLHQH